jgi:hypothetical protein
MPLTPTHPTIRQVRTVDYRLSGQPKIHIDRDWLREAYVVWGRSCADIGQECGNQSEHHRPCLAVIRTGSHRQATTDHIAVRSSEGHHRQLSGRRQESGSCRLPWPRQAIDGFGQEPAVARSLVQQRR